MSKRPAKLPANFVPVLGELRQGLLFADARTRQQNLIIEAADGTRTIAGIAHECGIRRDECEKIISKLAFDGELREAQIDEILAGGARLQNDRRFDEAITLYKAALAREPDSEEALKQLADLLATSLHTKDAASTYSRLCEIYTRDARLGEALNVARKAAGLQPGNWTHQNALAELCIMTGRQDEAARVWRAYAKRLSAVDKFDQALMIIDEAERKLPGNDILLYAEAEILSANERGSSVGVEREPRIEISQQEPEFAQDDERLPAENTYTPAARFGTAAYVIAGVTLLVICLAAYVFQLRENMQRAIGSCAGILSASSGESVASKLAAADNARKKLAAADPFLGFLRSNAFRQQQIRVNEFYAKAEQELAQQRIRQQAVIELWLKRPGQDRLASLKELTESSDTQSPYVSEAKRLYRQWQDEDKQRGEMKKQLLGVIKNSSDIDEKYKAYAQLFVKFPQVFSEDFPKGAKNLSLESDIRLYCGKYQVPLKFSLYNNLQPLSPPYALPLDGEVTLMLRHRGFKIAAGSNAKRYHTPLPKPYTKEQTFIMRKTARWKTKLSAGHKYTNLTLCEKNRAVVAAGANLFAVFAADTGALKHQEVLPVASEDLSPKTSEFILCGDKNTFVLLADRIYRVLPKFTNKPLLLAGTPISAVLAELNAPTIFTLNDGSDSEAVTAYSADNFKALWPQSQRPPAQVRAVGGIFISNWDIFYADSNAFLHHILENGEKQGSWQLEGIDHLQESPLYIDSDMLGKLMIVHQGGKLLCYKIQPELKPGVVKIWEVRMSGSAQQLLYTNNTLLVRSGESKIMAYQLTSGALVQDYDAPGKLSTAVSLSGNTLYLPAQTENQQGKLYAVQISDGKIGQIIWDMPLPVAPAALYTKQLTPQNNIIALISGDELCFIDD